MNGNNGWLTAHAKINLLDERFLPVENSGTVSEWQLELPANFREGDPCQFDYNTISDVVLHLHYTAREGSVMMRWAISRNKRDGTFYFIPPAS